MEQKDLKQALQERLSLHGGELDDLEGRLKELKERTTEFVQKYPLVSVGIALSLGFIIGRIFSGRRS